MGLQEKELKVHCYSVKSFRSCGMQPCTSFTSIYPCIAAYSLIFEDFILNNDVFQWVVYILLRGLMSFSLTTGKALRGRTISIPMDSCCLSSGQDLFWSLLS